MCVVWGKRTLGERDDISEFDLQTDFARFSFTARAALEKTHAQLLFERRNMPPYRRW
jgi:hypothetical protein